MPEWLQFRLALIGDIMPRTNWDKLTTEERYKVESKTVHLGNGLFAVWNPKAFPTVKSPTIDGAHGAFCFVGEARLPISVKGISRGQMSKLYEFISSFK